MLFYARMFSVPWLGGADNNAMTNEVSPDILKWVLVVSFVAMAAWVLIPDKLDDDEEISNRGPFIASFIAFFVAEIGDKTQIATSILGAQYADALSWVILGTTIGMLLANVPVLKHITTKWRLPVRMKSQLVLTLWF